MEIPKINDIMELKIAGISFEGKGISKIKTNKNTDFVIFCDGSVTGDCIKAIITKVKRNYADAKIIELVKPSVNRINPLCFHFGVCNGCKLQNFVYEKQLELKRANVISAFERIGGFINISVPDCISTDEIYNYRNKLEFSFSNNRWLTEGDVTLSEEEKNFALGFHKPGFADKVVDINQCHLQSDTSNNILNFTKEFFKSRNTSIYSVKKNEGFLRYLIIRQSKNTKGLMVILITFNENEDLINKYSINLKNTHPEISTFIHGISARRAQVAQADRYEVLWGDGYINEKLNEYTFKISPFTFFQTNTKQAEKLFKTASEFAEFNGNENVLDLYCGCGTIAIYISKLVNKVTCVELFKESIDLANENTEINKVTNCSFIAYDVKDYLKNLAEKKDENFDVIILDPPRSGIHPKAAEYLLEYEAPKIIYISCNPTTQARDIKLLSSKYNITNIQPIDMFPHTFHIENVVRLDIK